MEIKVHKYNTSHKTEICMSTLVKLDEYHAIANAWFTNFKYKR